MYLFSPQLVVIKNVEMQKLKILWNFRVVIYVDNLAEIFSGVRCFFFFSDSFWYSTPSGEATLNLRPSRKTVIINLRQGTTLIASLALYFFFTLFPLGFSPFHLSNIALMFAHLVPSFPLCIYVYMYALRRFLWG